MIGRILNERYRIDREIGQGGMGIVYLGYDTALERQVAIKVLSKSDLGTQGRGSLLSEAQTAAKLNHPNIVTVHDVGEEGTIPFIVMEYVEGTSLYQKRPESLEGTLAIMGQVCAGLGHAHEKGIIHRDLKPENVIVSKEGKAKLMDFGLARSIASRYTTEGTMAGTVFYLAPEQALGQEIDLRTDLYSLGVMMYELATGELPFVDRDPIAVISQHLHAPVVPPRVKNEHISPTLNELILSLMNKDPRDRPTSAGEVLKVLKSPGIWEVGISPVEEISLLDRIVRGRMVGRERELHQARQLWQNAKSGQGQMLLISGEPGIGKTRLMREIATQAEVSGGQVLIGECQEEGSAPYAPFAQITRRALRTYQHNGFEFPKPVLAELLELSPELRIDYPDVEPNPKLGPEAEQRRLFENVVRFCDILCQETPLLLVLEDIHWADSGSLHLLEHLARRTRQQMLMLLGTYREVELDEALPFHEVLLEITRRKLGMRVKLERLDKVATHDLLAVIFAEQITPEFLDGIYKETEGNPFFIEEVCKALVESGGVWVENGEWQRAPDIEDVHIPQGIRVAIQSRVNKLDQDTQGILLTSAVIGREFEYDTLSKVSVMEEDRLITCLEEAISKQLIVELKGGGGERFSFSHALIPAAIQENISGLRRTRLHRKIATAIEQLYPQEFERLAYHWGEAGDEEKGLAYTIKAAVRAQQAYANEDAVRLYSEVLALLPDDHSERFDFLAARAEAYDVMAKRAAQLQDIQEMIKVADRELETNRKIDALLALGKLYLETETEKAREPLEQALAITQDIGDAGREGLALYNLGRQAFFFADTFQAQEYFNASAARLQEAGLVGESAESMSFLSVALADLGDRPAALQAARQAVELSEKAGDKQLEALSTRRLAIAYMNQYQDSKALPIAESALHLFREIGDLLNEVHALNVLGIIKNYLGQFDESVANFLEAMEIAQLINHEVGIRWVISNIPDVYNWSLGEYTKRIELIKDQIEKASQSENDFLVLRLEIFMSRDLFMLGKYGEALALCEKNQPLFNDLDEITRGLTFCLMALQSANLGKHDQSYRYLKAAGEISSRSQNPWVHTYMKFFTAIVAIIFEDISRVRVVLKEITGELPALLRRGDKSEIGDISYVKAKLHLALLELDPHQAESALECIIESLECFQFRPSSWIMPEQVHFLHSLALRVNGLDEQADKALRTAYQRLMKVAGNIDYQDLRRSYLENVRENQAIQDAYRERFG